ncbi:MAG: helix-turn-helix transcriptional regulator [Selenomonadaceae bacterium]|nr:helix-turn-helix transcriptional regulator [Selenomonadaceae bacterium]
MAYTSFGEFVRILRIKHHEVMGDMAKKLETSLSFLSAVENGKKNVPADWASKLANIYELTSTELDNLIEAIEESKTQFKISASNSGNNQRKAALQFTRSFANMDDETALKILELLTSKGGK